MNYNLSFTIPKSSKKKTDIDEIVKLVKPNCTEVKLKRFEDLNDGLDISLYIEYKDTGALKKITDDLKSIDDSVNICFLDNENVYY